MRLSWAQGVAGVLTCAVVAGLLLLPGRLLGPDRPIHVAVPLPQAARSVQAAPPLVIRHLHHPAKQPKSPVGSTRRRFTYVRTQPRTVVQVAPARKLLQSHRSAVIQKLAPTAPLVRARVLAAITVPRHVATPASSTAKTIAALAASLSKK
ncbi:MAG: hypothetical protein QOD52_857 [Gaiellaceae bacterium]|nr:hypothetical protein [Gaiellaceae bacterium]